MSRLVWSEEELLQSHAFARPQVEAGRRLHGGFDAEGRYVPPRLLHRAPAVAAWTASLRARGGDLLPADASLLAGIRFPSEGQQKLLIREGLSQTFWNTLTITGKIEARGQYLAVIELPDLQAAVEEDLSERALGHLGKGLLRAHGLDEGGEPELGIGGHDVMWFALRDLAFGPTDWPDPEVPEIARSESEAPWIPGVSLAVQRTIYFLLNLLMIEFRAERGFRFSEGLLRDPELFGRRREEALRAAEIVSRIRLDEAIHVASLRLYLGELRQLHFRGRDGSRIPGRSIVDPLWQGIVRWATVEQPPLAAARQRELLVRRILSHRDGARILREFDALGEAS